MAIVAVVDAYVTVLADVGVTAVAGLAALDANVAAVAGVAVVAVVAAVAAVAGVAGVAGVAVVAAVAVVVHYTCLSNLNRKTDHLSRKQNRLNFLSSNTFHVSIWRKFY